MKITSRLIIRSEHGVMRLMTTEALSIEHRTPLPHCLVDCCCCGCRCRNVFVFVRISITWLLRSHFVFFFFLLFLFALSLSSSKSRPFLVGGCGTAFIRSFHTIFISVSFLLRWMCIIIFLSLPRAVLRDEYIFRFYFLCRCCFSSFCMRKCFSIYFFLSLNVLTLSVQYSFDLPVSVCRLPLQHLLLEVLWRKWRTRWIAVIIILIMWLTRKHLKMIIPSGNRTREVRKLCTWSWWELMNCIPLQYTQKLARAMLFDSDLNVQDKRIIFFPRSSEYAWCILFIILSRSSSPTLLDPTAAPSDEDTLEWNHKTVLPFCITSVW